MATSNDLRSILIKVISFNLSKVLDYDRLDKALIELNSYKEDPVFSLFFLDTKEIVLARARGAFIMSITRKLGDLYEVCINEIVKHTIGLNNNQIKYIANIANENRILDTRILKSEIKIDLLKDNVNKIISHLGDKYKTKFNNKKIFNGLGFEIRYCYQIGDSKRIQADIHMAEHLFENDILPVMLIFCSTSLKSPVTRFRNKSYWAVYEGLKAYDFIHNLTGFDFYGFLKEENTRLVIRKIMNKIYSKFKANNSIQTTL